MGKRPVNIIEELSEVAEIMNKIEYFAVVLIGIGLITTCSLLLWVSA